MEIAHREFLKGGRSSPHLGGDTFGLEDIRAFCQSVDAIGTDSPHLTQAFCSQLAAALKGKDIEELEAGVYSFKSMPEQRFLPKTWDGTHVRQKYYIRGSAFESLKKEIIDRDKKRIEAAIDLYEEDRVQHDLEWKRFVKWGMVIDSEYDPKKGPADYLDASFDVDHKNPLAKHWCEVGFNAPQANRHQAAGGKRNLRLMLSSENRSKGAEGYTYAEKMWVGPNFEGPGGGRVWAAPGVRFDNLKKNK